MFKKKGGNKGQHKVRGPVKNRKEGVTPKSINQNTMSPRPVNTADLALGKLRGY
jgi:hypothetical protein